MTKNNPTPQSFIRLELLCSLGASYGKSSKKEKMQTLDFLHKQFGISKNTLAKLLRKAARGTLKSKTYLRGRKPIYCDLCVFHLKKLWSLLDEMGPEKMKAAMPIWLPHYTDEFKLSAPIAEKLMKMSARTIARLLDPHKKSLAKKEKCKTHAASKRAKYKIPVKNFSMKIKAPGFVEADTVAHCGTSLLGPHLWTLTVTDIATTWTELEIMNDKTAQNTKDAVAHIELKAVAETLATKMGSIQKITIIGHTSLVGSNDSNMWLSRKRATAVKNILVAQGIPSRIIHTDAKGESEPLINSESEEANTANRRVEFKVETKE